MVRLHHSTHLARQYRHRCHRSKVGVGPLTVPPRCRPQQVISEGLTAHDPARQRDFVIVWQNLKGAQTFAVMSPVARMIEATISGLTPQP